MNKHTISKTINKQSKNTKFILAFSGASGIRLGMLLLRYLPKDFMVFVVLSNGAISCAKSELGLDIKDFKQMILGIRNVEIFEDYELDAPISSGSFGVDIMAIVPASMDCIAKIACGISDSLLTRSAAVILKEQKKLLLAPREMPFNAIMCKNMASLAKMGVIISPPILGYYAKPKNLEDMERFIIGKWLDVLGIENDLYRRWGA